MANAPESVENLPRDGTVEDEHAEYPAHFFPVVGSDHTCLHENQHFEHDKKTTILSKMSSTI